MILPSEIIRYVFIATSSTHIFAGICTINIYAGSISVSKTIVSFVPVPPLAFCYAFLFECFYCVALQCVRFTFRLQLYPFEIFNTFSMTIACPVRTMKTRRSDNTNIITSFRKWYQPVGSRRGCVSAEVSPARPIQHQNP